MSLRGDIKSGVGGYAPLVAKIGLRFYPIRLPQEPTLPSVMFTVLPGMDEVTHQGRAGWFSHRVQFDSFATTPLEAEEVIDLVRDALYEWHQVDPQYTAFPDTPEDMSEPELERFRMTLDVVIQKGA